MLVLLVVFAAYVHGGAKARARDDGGRRRSSVAAARQALRDHGPQFRRNLVAVTILVTYLVLPSVTTTIFRTYDCETVDDPDGEGKKRYLRVRHDTRCEGRAYRLTAIFAGLACVIWPVGVPLLYICELAYHRAAKESEIPNFKGSYLGRFPLVSADFWTSDHLSERSRSADACSGTRARGTRTLKRR